MVRLPSGTATMASSSHPAIMPIMPISAAAGVYKDGLKHARGAQNNPEERGWGEQGMAFPSPCSLLMQGTAASPDHSPSIALACRGLNHHKHGCEEQQHVPLHSLHEGADGNTNKA